MEAEYCATIFLISEDSARCSAAVAEALARRMLRVVDPQVATQRVLFLPLDRESPGAACSHGDRWRSRDPKDREARRQLVLTIATYLSVPNGFVFYHVDGDTPWAKRSNARNRTDFLRIFEGELRRFLGTKVAPEEVDLRLARLFLIMPHYCIESWLYQNTDEALKICQAEYAGRDAVRFRTWAADRALLDEVLEPKTKICFRDKHNRELAERSFPAEAVYGAGKSFASVVNALTGSAALVTAIAATYRV